MVVWKSWCIGVMLVYKLSWGSFIEVTDFLVACWLHSWMSSLYGVPLSATVLCFHCAEKSNGQSLPFSHNNYRSCCHCCLVFYVQFLMITCWSQLALIVVELLTAYLSIEGWNNQCQSLYCELLYLVFMHSCYVFFNVCLTSTTDHLL